MYKIIIKFLLILGLSFFFVLSSFAAQVKVENIFSDIDSNYKYLTELQTLYDKGIVSPDNLGKLNPYKLITREEFVGIVMEVSCKDCIKPDVSIDLIQKYGSVKPFYDVGLNNDYFYCIADANSSGVVSGYHESTTCEDGTFKDGEKPFCPNNTIILEEALAVLLRTSNILSDSQAQVVRSQIAAGTITQSLSDDVTPLNLDGSVYSFYPDFQKALEYELVEYDLEGNRVVSKMVEVVDGKLRPKKNITKEDFIRMASVVLKANSCSTSKKDNLALEINIYDKSCTQSDKTCSLSDLNDESNIYDFKAEVGGLCELGIEIPQGYIWRFIHSSSGEELKKYGEYIDDYSFLSPGNRKIYLRVLDKCGNTGEIYNSLYIQGSKDIDTDLSVSIDANPISGEAPLLSGFEAIVENGDGPYSYQWSFSNGDILYSKNIEYLFNSSGIYRVNLTVIDKNGKIKSAEVLILVGKNSQGVIIQDSDGDGVTDDIDKCPLLIGDERNMGCPILDDTCKSDGDCNDGFYCDRSGSVGICSPLKIEQSCLYNGNSTFFGNAICNSCPCAVSLDFNATLRKCDVVFPAITSPDGSVFYSKGDYIRIDK